MQTVRLTTACPSTLQSVQTLHSTEEAPGLPTPAAAARTASYLLTTTPWKMLAALLALVTTHFTGALGKDNNELIDATVAVCGM